MCSGWLKIMGSADCQSPSSRSRCWSSKPHDTYASCHDPICRRQRGGSGTDARVSIAGGLRSSELGSLWWVPLFLLLLVLVDAAEAEVVSSTSSPSSSALSSEECCSAASPSLSLLAAS